MKQDWSREQKQHELEFTQQKTQEELERKREQETYQYNISLSRKRKRLSAGFNEQKEKAVKEALDTLEKEFTEKIVQEKKLREQETKAEKDL